MLYLINNEMKNYFLLLTTIISLNAFSQTLKDGLVAFYPFTGNAIDSSGKGNNGTVSAATLTTDRFGKSNAAYLFNGSTSEIRVTSPFGGNQPFTTNASICYWIKTNTTKDAATVLCLHSSCSNNANDLMTFYINNRAGAHYLYNTIYWASPLLSVDQSTVTDNAWHFVCYTYNHDTAKLYMDGTKVSQSLVTPEPGFGFDQNTDLTIGNISSNACGYDFHFEGTIDDIIIYNRTLNQNEISKIKQNTLSIETIGLKNLPKVYPNPSTGIVNITNLIPSISTIEITDITGKSILVKSTTFTDFETIDISAYTKGFYNIIFRNNLNEIISTEKLILAE